MKKFTLLALVLALTTVMCFAQDQKKGYVIVSAGLNSALGNLADAPSRPPIDVNA